MEISNEVKKFFAIYSLLFMLLFSCINSKKEKQTFMQNDLVTLKDFPISKNWDLSKIIGKDFWLLNNPDAYQIEFFEVTKDIEQKIVSFDEGTVFDKNGVLVIAGSDS